MRRALGMSGLIYSNNNGLKSLDYAAKTIKKLSLKILKQRKERLEVTALLSPEKKN